MAIKTNWKEVNQIIKEEFQRLMTKNKLKARIKQINEELGQMDSEDNSLEEVEAAGTEKLAPGQSFGGGQGEKFKPKFEKKGSHLLEDEDEETLEIGIEGGEGEAEEKGELSLADEFAELGAAIEAKIRAVLGGESESAEGAEGAEGASTEDNGEEFEEVEVDSDGVEGNVEGSEDENAEEVDEYAEVQGGVGAEQGMTADQAVKTESVEEPLEGHSVAQDADADKVNDNLEKDTHVKEGKNKTGKVIAESKETKSAYLNILSEGLDKNQKSALQSEIDRMRKLAKLDNNE
jgi:hypothetical protein